MSFAAPGERDLGHSDDDERSEPAGAHSARGHDLDHIRELSVRASVLRCTRISPEVEISGETCWWSRAVTHQTVDESMEHGEWDAVSKHAISDVI